MEPFQGIIIPNATAHAPPTISLNAITPGTFSRLHGVSLQPTSFAVSSRVANSPFPVTPTRVAELWVILAVGPPVRRPPQTATPIDVCRTCGSRVSHGGEFRGGQNQISCPRRLACCGDGSGDEGKIKSCFLARESTAPVMTAHGCCYDFIPISY